MQILNLDADLNISRLDADIRTLRLGDGGTTNYNDLTNKPSINSVTLTGNKTTSDLNIKTSDLDNDAGFITNADIPTKTSDLTNDSGFQTAAQVSSAVAAAIPTNVSSFTNDAGYITAAQVGNIPTKTSDLTNDSGFITSAEAPVQSINDYTGAVELDGTNLDYSAALSINDKIDAVEAAIPNKTSDLTNDSGFITGASIPTNVSDFTNDAGYITSAQAPVQSVNGYTGAVELDGTNLDYSEALSINDKIDAVEGAIPTKTSDLTNDAGYQTAADVNTLVQAAMPVTETIENESIASFSDGADNVPVNELIVNITATQAGSGTPSPSNPRAISGHSSCTITVEDDIDDPQEVKTVSISLGDTYYGGTLNVTTGELTIDRGYIEFDASADENWINVGGNYPFAFQIDTGLTNIYTVNITEQDIISNMYPQATTDVPSSNAIRWQVSTYLGRLYVYDYDYSSDLNGFKNMLQNTPLQVCYKLDTPITIQLTPTEVRTLLEDNNIFADTGDINELVYFKTGCEPIARLIEAYT